MRPTSDRVAAMLGRNADLWRERSFAPRRRMIETIAAVSGLAPALLDESIYALLAPLAQPALEALASGFPKSPRTFGFIMPSNVPGAGIHEVCGALLAGARIIIKPASAEPYFFPGFLGTLAEIDADVAAMTSVMNFSRDDAAAMSELWERCDGGVVAYGDDASVAALEASRGSRPFVGYPSRVSGALVMADAIEACETAAAIAAAVARDVTLFEQRGCLSPHHVFVAEQCEGKARGFAARLALALERMARRLPPPRHPLSAAAAIRGLRERARWRELARRQSHDAGLEDVTLWEGERLGWTVIYDRDGAFCASPGYRTVFVSALSDPAELRERLGVADGRIEAFALAAGGTGRADLERLLCDVGASYVCEPGMMQSPPLDWPHGGGSFFELLRSGSR